MKLIVGLGNPGIEYDNTRHNVGFMIVERLAEILNSKSQILNNQQIPNFKLQNKFQAAVFQINNSILIKPQTFMNRSGQAVSALVNFYKLRLDQLLVCHDDLDLSLGSFKLELARGPKVHNGVNSVEQSLGSKEFWRLRFGVDNRTPELRQQLSGSEFVLKPLSSAEKGLFEAGILEASKLIQASFLEQS